MSDCRHLVAEHEALARVAAVQKVTTAMTTGAWPCDVRTLDALAALLEVAARWQLVAELELAA